MFKIKRPVEKYAAKITVNGHELPVEIVLEQRRGTRFSIAKEKVIMRLRTGTPSETIRSELARLQDWVTQVNAKKPAAIERFAARVYQNGQLLVVGKRTYVLEITTEARAAHTARLIGNTIAIRLSTKATPPQCQRAIQTLLSRVIGGDYLNEITARVQAINQRTFNRPITRVYLKHNHSNWGSCSTNGNVNLSTRLLFAPEEVQDYVILHELAHLVEMNHSDRFWALVEKYMPTYPEKEKWLKVNGGNCNF